MKSCSKKGWKSLMPLRLSRSSTHFCMFPKVRSASQTSGNAPVYLNVYDLTPINGYMYWAGLGIYHTGVEVHGVEYAFGAHDYPSSGVFEVEPRQCPGFRFRKSIFMGTTCLDPLQLREFMELQSVNYNGDTYHLIMKNCNHFCKDICYKLTGNSIPKWVNRLAGIAYIQLVINQDCQARREVVKIVNPTEFSEVVSIPDKSQGFKLARLKEGEVGQFGASLALGSTSNDSGCSLCNCLLPEALKITAVQHDPDSPSEDGEKRRLRSAFGCLSSISMRQRQFSASSLLLTSPFRGSLSHWDFRRSGAIPLKDT